MTGIIRCEYCSHYDYRWQRCNNPEMKPLEFPYYSLRMKPDDYCSKGKSKVHSIVDGNVI